MGAQATTGPRVVASIRKLADGRWQAQYRPIPGGKQITRTTRRKLDAQLWLDEQQALVVTGRFVDPGAGRITFGAYYQSWSERQIWATGTKRSMDRTARSVTFWDVPLRLLRRSHIEEWVKHLSTVRVGRSKPGDPERGLAASTVKAQFAHVRTVLRAAVADKRLISDPSVQVKIPRGRRMEMAMAIPSIAQVRAVLAVASPEFRLFLALCALAGLRRGEATALKVKDVDPTQRILTVSRQAQFYIGASTEIRAPKSGSERKVNLADMLVTMVRSHICSLGQSAGPESWIFSGSDGGPIHTNRIEVLWRKAKQDACVEDFRIHDLRHFYASGLIAAGCDVITVQRALGHANATMTLSTYAHLWPTGDDRIRSASADMLAEVFRSSDE